MRPRPWNASGNNSLSVSVCLPLSACLYVRGHMYVCTICTCAIVCMQHARELMYVHAHMRTHMSTCLFRSTTERYPH